MKIKGATVIGIGVVSFLGGVVAGVAACRKDALRAAGQFFGGVVSGTGAVAVAVATAETRTAMREAEERRKRQEVGRRELVLQYLRVVEARANAATIAVFWCGLSPEERLYVRSLGL